MDGASNYSYRIGRALENMEGDKRSELFNLQKKYIQVETKLMFEKDRNTKQLLRDQLNKLRKKRWELINSYE